MLMTTHHVPIQTRREVTGTPQDDKKKHDAGAMGRTCAIIMSRAMFLHRHLYVVVMGATRASTPTPCQPTLALLDSHEEEDSQ